ncbi:MAG: T9SS type A sorting domain-containing protein [Bacteroidota bacterium]
MKAKFTLFLAFLFSFQISSFGQLSNGATAPNWTLTDIDGNQHTLYNYLDAGKMVILDFSATWCPPCWNYHQTHVLEDFYNQRGPNGTDEAMVFMIESDLGTNLQCIYGQAGCNGTSLGDWTAGVSYPIISLDGSNGPNVGSLYSINFYPTLYAVCSDRKIYEVGQPGISTWFNWIASCTLEGSGMVTSNEDCFGGGNGQVDVNSSGGYSTISYSWSNGANTEDLVGVGAGTYTLTITEAQGRNVQVGPFTITGPSSPVAVNVTNTTNVSCIGNSNGTISTMSTGGTPGYTYAWNTGATTANIAGLSGGTYTLTVTDLNGCTEVQSAVVTEPPLLTLQASAFPENCNQGDGILFLTPNGGSPGYTYDIGNGPTGTSQFFNMTAGTYVATITDANGCQETASATVGALPGPPADAGADGVIDCQNFQVTLDGSNSNNGAGGVSYQWTTSSGSILSGGNTAFPVVNAAGAYVLQITDIVTGCTATDIANVTANISLPVADAGADQTIDCTSAQVNLNGSNSASGGNITYLWTTTNGNIVSGETSTNPLVNATGTYTLVVTDNGTGCTQADDVVVLGNTTAPVADAGPSGSLNCNVGNVTLDGSASSTGGTFTYQWTTNNGNIVSGGTTLTPNVDAAGTYSLIVTNTANNCTSEASTMVNSNTTTPTADPGNGGTITCANLTVTLNGSNSSGGNNLSYEWFDDSNNSISNNVTTNVVNPGNYSLVVTNNDNGCTGQASVVVDLDDDLPIAVANSSGNLDCTVGSVTLNSNGSSQGTYEWFDPNNNSIGNGATVDVSTAGTYSFSVIDNNNGCSSWVTVNVTENVTAPNASATASGTISCTNATVTLDGSASSSGNNFTYNWTDVNGNTLGTNTTVDVTEGGDYTLMVTNTDNGCTASVTETVIVDAIPPTVDPGPGATLDCTNAQVTLTGSGTAQGGNISYEWFDPNGNSISNTASVSVTNTGAYSLVVTDLDNGCSVSSSADVDEDYQAPTANAGTGGQLDCVNSSVTLDGSASSTGNNFTYLWTDDNGSVVGTSVTISVAAEGEYNLIVTNSANGCTAESQTSVTASNDFPTVAVNGSNMLNCLIQTVTLDGTGSSAGANFSYEWLDPNGNSIGSNITVEATNAGSYSLVVTDNTNGCSASSNYVLEENTTEPTAVANATSVLDCSNTTTTLDATGSATGTGIAYEWMDANGNFIGTGTTVEVGAAGTYTLIVSDAQNGCTNTTTAEVIASADIPLANAGSEGTLNCNVTSLVLDGANSSTGNEYSYEWTTANGSIVSGSTTLTPTVDAAGTYSLLVINNDNGCTATSEVVVAQTPVIDIEEESVTSVTCFGESNGAASVTVSGGNGTYTYAWSNGGSESSIESVTAGMYEVVVTDQDNCSATYTVEVEQPAELLANANATDESSYLGNNGTASASPSGGTSGYTYLWSNGATEATLTDLAPGTYTVSITDANGCEKTETVEVEAFICSIASDVASVDVSCFGANDGQATATLTQGSGTPTYEWSNGTNTSSIENLGSGTYTVTLTDANNCPSIQEITITEPNEILSDIVDVVNVACANDATGSATVAASGGAGNLSYQWSTGVTTETANNLAAGTYVVSITDANFCQITTSVEIIANDDEMPQAITQNIMVALDADGVATIDPIMVDDGSTDNCELVGYDLDVTSFDCSNLGMNQVILTVTDGAGNTNSAMAMVNVMDNTAPTITCSGDIVSDNCNGVTYDVPSAADNCSVANIELIAGLGSGQIFPEGTTEVIYRVVDASGNEATCSFNVTVENTLDLETINNMMPLCNGDANGSISPLVIGGTPGYTYAWSDGQTTETASNLTAGTYTLQVTDANGCDFEVTTTLDEPDPLTADLAGTDPSCYEALNGSIVSTIGGGTAGYTYLWSDGQTTPNANSLTAGTYTLQVTDANGCEVSSTELVLTEPDSLSLVIDNVTNASTPTATDGGIDVTIGGGVGGYTYAWELNGNIISTDEDLTNAAPGDYLLTVTDANGCVKVSEVVTIESPTLVVDPNLDKYIELLPNPTDGNFMVKLELLETSEVQIRIFDVTGKEVITSTKQNITQEQIEFNLARFDNGVYIVKITVDNAVLAKRLVLQRF